MIRTLLLLLRALLQLLLRAIAATPLRPVHLLPLVKGRNNESSPKLRVYGAPNRTYMRTARSFVYYAIVFPLFCQKAVKQTDEMDCLFK